MSNKAATRKSDKLDAFHLLPPEHDMKLIYVKLNEDVLQALLNDRTGQAMLYLDPDREGGSHSPCEEIKLGDKSWKFEYKKENDELHHCLSRDPRQIGIYKSVGTVRAKLLIKSELTGTVKAKIKKKSEETSQQKRARSQSAIHQDDLHIPSKKRKPSEATVSTSIDSLEGPSRKQLKQAKSAQRSSALKPQESETERKATLERLKEEIMYALAVQDMSKEDLNKKYDGMFASEDFKKLLTELAEWKTAERVYKLRHQLYSKVYVELWPKYSTTEREQARARVGRGVMVAVEPITCREKAKEYMEKQRSLSESYMRLGEELQQMQQAFEALEDKLKECEEGGDEEGKRRVSGEVMRSFEDKKDSMFRMHFDYMRLHEHLKSLKEALVAWKESRRAAGGAPASLQHGRSNGPAAS